MPETSFPAVTIIIPNYNGADLMRTNLPAVLAARKYYGGHCQVIVVDDASVDGSEQVLRTEFPSVICIQHEHNQGFAAAVQSGVDAAASDFLILLNSDVRPDANFIFPLIKHLVDPEVFSVSPLVVNSQEKPSAESWRCYCIRRGRLRMVDWADRIPSVPVETLFASGGSIAISKTRFMELGGFLPLFKPFYSEDTDLGLRAWRRGWRSLFEPTCRVIHDHRGSANSTQVSSNLVRRVRLRNRFLLEWLHVPSVDLRWRLGPGYVLQVLGRLVRLDFLYFGGLLGALRLLPRVLAVRAEIQAQERLGFWDIMARIENSLEKGMAGAGTSHGQLD